MYIKLAELARAGEKVVIERSDDPITVCHVIGITDKNVVERIRLFHEVWGHTEIQKAYDSWVISDGRYVVSLKEFMEVTAC